ITVANISRLVLGEVMQYKKEEVTRFIADKCKALPAHGLQEKYDEVELENEERRRIASYYDELL
ncbi:hypothetical protein OY671_012845, partial [Metschnikowia pulcherrima]